MGLAVGNLKDGVFQRLPAAELGQGDFGVDAGVHDAGAIPNDRVGLIRISNGELDPVHLPIVDVVSFRRVHLQKFVGALGQSGNGNLAVCVRGEAADRTGGTVGIVGIGLDLFADGCSVGILHHCQLVDRAGQQMRIVEFVLRCAALLPILGKGDRTFDNGVANGHGRAGQSGGIPGIVGNLGVGVNDHAAILFQMENNVIGHGLMVKHPLLVKLVANVRDQVVGQGETIGCARPGNFRGCPSGCLGWRRTIHVDKSSRKRTVFSRECKLRAGKWAFIIDLLEGDGIAGVLHGQRIGSGIHSLERRFAVAPGNNLAVLVHPNVEGRRNPVAIWRFGFRHQIDFAADQALGKFAREICRFQAFNGHILLDCRAIFRHKLTRYAEFRIAKGCFGDRFSLRIHLRQPQLNGCVGEGQRGNIVGIVRCQEFAARCSRDRTIRGNGNRCGSLLRLIARRGSGFGDGVGVSADQLRFQSIRNGIAGEVQGLLFRIAGKDACNLVDCVAAPADSHVI